MANYSYKFVKFRLNSVAQTEERIAQLASQGWRIISVSAHVPEAVIILEREDVLVQTSNDLQAAVEKAKAKRKKKEEPVDAVSEVPEGEAGNPHFEAMDLEAKE